MDKFKDFGDISLIPNGYSPRLLNSGKPKGLKRGTITAGFFGHLHQARFNWDLLIKTAEIKKDWMFYIIGFGEPSRLVLPENVVKVGPVEPAGLAGYAKNWDVALIPYQYNEMCKKLNPIKIFEYLYFSLPIVATGCEDVKNYPYSFYASGVEEFIGLIEKAAVTTVEQEKIRSLLQEATWECRVRLLLDLIETRNNYKSVCTG
jgi:glycosyltransferase involved in cell wall biosynthesis